MGRRLDQRVRGVLDVAGRLVCLRFVPGLVPRFAGRFFGEAAARDEDFFPAGDLDFGRGRPARDFRFGGDMVRA